MRREKEELKLGEVRGYIDTIEGVLSREAEEKIRRLLEG